MVGNSIKERRKTLRVTQSQLAELAEISVNTLYKIERGQANPTLDTLTKIADVLGMDGWSFRCGNIGRCGRSGSGFFWKPGAGPSAGCG